MSTHGNITLCTFACGVGHILEVVRSNGSISLIENLEASERCSLPCHGIEAHLIFLAFLECKTVYLVVSVTTVYGITHTIIQSVGEVAREAVEYTRTGTGIHRTNEVVCLGLQCPSGWNLIGTYYREAVGPKHLNHIVRIGRTHTEIQRNTVFTRIIVRINLRLNTCYGQLVLACYQLFCTCTSEFQHFGHTSSSHSEFFLLAVGINQRCRNFLCINILIERQRKLVCGKRQIE